MFVKITILFLSLIIFFILLVDKNRWVPDINIDLFFEDQEVVNFLLKLSDELGQLLHIRIQLIGLPDQTNSLGYRVLNFFAQISDLIKEESLSELFILFLNYVTLSLLSI